MNQESPIVCTTYEEINSLIPLITQLYNAGCYVHFLNLDHMNENCNFIQDSYKVIFITANLKQAAKIIINLYNEHFPPKDDEDDEDDDDDDEEDDDDETEVDPEIAFTCPVCDILTL